jgi:hypothetical protein
MRHRFKNTYAAQWHPIFELWVRFCREADQLGISPTSKAMANFLTVHRTKLMELGVLVKSNKQRVLGHRDYFAPAAFALLIGQDPARAIQQQRLSLAPSQTTSHDHAA